MGSALPDSVEEIPERLAAGEIRFTVAAAPYDADQLTRAIEHAAGHSVAELFASEGEAGFRKREREALEALAGRRLVVALGGGAAAQPGMADLLVASGCLVYLRARPETLAARIAQDGTRPLLADLDAAAQLERLRGLLTAREPSYLRASLVLDTDALDAERAAAELGRRLDVRA